MDAIRPTLPASAKSANALLAPGSANGRAATLERAAPGTALERTNAALAIPATAGRAAAPVRRSAARWDHQVQANVARAQQAIDYLERVGAQLESAKSQIAARLSSHQVDARQLEARLRQLSATLDARVKSGGGVDARLDFQAGQPASQRFRMRGLEVDSLQASAPQTLAFSVGGLGGPQLSVAIEPGMTRQEIAQRFDRALAPVKVRASLDANGELLFATPESGWPLVRDNIAVSGRGRVTTEAEPALLAPQSWDTGNLDALRQNLREVVQALARVRRAQDAAGAALSEATQQAARAETPVVEAAALAQDFAATAARPDYESLLAITSALVGVSRERVMALLGLR
ncbi:MAG TPA: hypothetical protein VF861_13825 [Telluria sp.]